MTALLDALATAVAAAAVLVAALVWAATRAWSPAVPVLLDLLLAAGLLHLAAEPDWPAIGTAASLVALRKAVTTAARRGRAADPAGGPLASPARLSRSGPR